MALRIVFCGTPAFAVPAFRHLVAHEDFEVAGVVTQPDRPRGRGRQTASSSVKDAALEAGIAVFQPAKIKSDEAYDYFRRLAPDAVVIIAYGQIIPERLIDIPRLGWINLHASLLPKYRGAAPINWAILNGETRTGITAMRIDAGLDTGPMLMKYETTIGPDEAAPELAARLADAGAPLMADTLRALDRGEITPTPQDNSRATLAPPLKKNDGQIDWRSDAPKIYNRIRGLQPWPGAFTTFRGKHCQIWGRPLKPVAAGGMPGFILPTQEDGLLVICGGNTVLRVEQVQLEGRNRVTDGEFMNGARIRPGERFGG
ncbi:MAG TPA: methionyl-tRNA formyltransferase [Candidatus Acidoferrales bacterium]|nr:methionyl-tRNA formyltransferase [Candidatus Acidoferrales bacterium]